ncbi:SflA family class IV lanthipeptide [Kitasatospora sp. NBC_01560]|uniref:SflA family class IV lanthipeptide n=1 Tax=Kitasatospora sp. NBC_01560 TaxID=2975965 RepID=UPI00386B4CD7
MPVAMLNEIRDAGPLVVDDEAVLFEDDDRTEHSAAPCLADPWVTATTRFACDLNT